MNTDHTTAQPLEPGAPVDRVALAATLAGILSRTTGLRLDDLDPEASFLELGLSSIALVDTFRAVREALGVRPSIRRVFEEHRTLEKLTGYIAELLEAGERAPRRDREAVVVDGATELSIPPSLAHVWFLARYSEEASRAHQSAAGVRIGGALEPARIERAWAALVQRHGALRVRAVPDRDALFVEPPGGPAPVQRVRAEGAELLPVIQAAASDTIDLARASVRLTVIDAGGQGTLVIVAAHALVADRPSLELLLVELCTLLGDLDAVLPSALPFAEVLARLADHHGPESLAYFRAQLGEGPPALDLPTDRPRPLVKAYGGARLVRPVPAAVVAGVAQVARQVGVPSSVVVLGALAHLLRRLTGTRPVVIGVHGRLDEIVPLGAAAVAPLSGPLPVLVPLGADDSVRQLLHATRSALAGALDHAGAPFAALVDALEPRRDQSRSALFVVSFDAQGERPLPPIDGLDLERIQLPTATCRTDLALSWIDGAAGVELALDYSTELFDRSTAVAWGKALIVALEVLPQVLDGSSAALARAAGGAASLAAPAPASPPLPVPAFLAVARAHSDRAAVLSAHAELTYGALERGSASLAARLVELGVDPEHRVGISLARGPLLVQAVLAVLRAGAAYVPLDPAYPAARLQTVAEDAALSALITDHPAAWADPALQRVSATEAGAPTTLLPEPHPSHAAYVLFTSGSTGRPKGVVVEHGSLAQLLAWAHRTFSPADLAHTFASTSLSFDLSAFELLAPLTSGGGAVVIARDALELVDHPERERVTLLNTVPSAAAELVRMGALPRSLRVVALAGEALRGALVRAVRSQLPAGARILNLYGPTECTVYATAAELGPHEVGEPAIGRPIAGLAARVVDDEGAPCPPGGRGELWLSGPTVARGYLGRPDLTAQRFVEDPLSPGARAYRTGDLVRQRSDGQLEYLGRLDQQVKLRGFRIELGEIEAALTGALGAAEARVESEGEGVEQRLVAYVAGVGARTAADVRAALAERLPDPMVPRHIVVMDALPRLPNGKLDRAALPRGDAHTAMAPAPATSDAAPRSATERVLAEVWASILDVPSVSTTDDFFALGGHSLMMTALLVAIRERFGVRPKLRAMFDAPTLAGLARHVDALVGERSRDDDAPRGRTEADDPARVAARFARLDRDSELPADLEFVGAGVDPGAPARHLLLTGATGFVGVHVLAELLRRSDARVTCVARGADPMARIRAALDTFHLAEGLDLSRVEALSGDVARPALGLSPDDYQRLSASCDRVLHGAAEVNFVYPYDALQRTNVGGTREVLRFAARTRTKPLFFLSTSAVWPMGAELSFEEDADLHHGHRLNLGYDESKWVGERMVERARELGLPAFVLRPGEVSGHSVTGRGVGEHFAMALVKGSLEIGAVPPFFGMVDLSPVDYVAAGTAELASGPLPSAHHFHLTNPWPMDAREMLGIMREVGYRFEEPPFEAWKRRLFDHPGFAQNALYPYAPILEDFDPRNLQFPHYGSTAARAELEPRGVRCHPLDRRLVHTYLSYYRAIGFLPAP